MIRVTLVLIAVTLSVAGCASSANPAVASLDGSPVASISRWDVGPDQFVSLRDTASDDEVVALSDVPTGKLVRDLLPAVTASGMQVTGLAVDHAGDVWITYSKGPAYQNDTSGGDPKPGSCANQVDVVHAGTGRVTVALRTAGNVLIWGAQPSPDGRELVYRESPCTGYEETYLSVTSLFSEQHWSIGQGLPDCHLLAGAAWSMNGKTLLTDYGPAAQPYSYGVNSGACVQWWAGRLVQVNASTAQQGLAGRTVLADPNCQIDAVSSMADGGALAVEGCGGGPEFMTGPVSLLVIGADGRIARRLPLGACADGADIAMDQAGTAALVSAYLSCGTDHSTQLWEYRDGALRHVLGLPGDGGAMTMLAWRG
jgi:hypothetical protein